MLLLLLVAATAPHCTASTAPHSPALSGNDLAARLNASIKSGASSFSIPPGDYIFANASLVLEGASNFELIALGNGARLWFDIQYGFRAERCSNMRVAGELRIMQTHFSHWLSVKGRLSLIIQPVPIIRAQ